MAVRFDLSSATITIGTAPEVKDPVIGYQAMSGAHIGTFAKDISADISGLVGGNHVWFLSGPIATTGTVFLDGDPGDNANNWELGFLQVRYVRTTWLHYKANWTDPGASNGGSMLLQLGKPPALPKQTCRDIGDGGPATQIWYARGLNARGDTRPFPQALIATFSDQPGTTMPVVVVNSLTHQPNYLREGQVELLFCTALALQGPGGRFQILKHFYWNVLWQATFQPSNFFIAPYGPWEPPTVLRTATAAHMSKFIDGAPDQEPFRNVLTSTAETQTCNELFRRGFKSVLNPPFTGRRESRDRDHTFDVRV
jgi:hypothetical protein